MDVERAADLYARGRSLRQIGAELGVPWSTVGKRASEGRGYHASRRTSASRLNATDPGAIKDVGGNTRTVSGELSATEHPPSELDGIEQEIVTCSVYNSFDYERRDTVDQDFAQNRQRFLAEQGYAYTILDAHGIGSAA